MLYSTASDKIKVTLGDKVPRKLLFQAIKFTVTPVMMTRDGSNKTVENG